MVDTLKTLLTKQGTGVVSSFGSVGLSLTELEVWVKIIVLGLGGLVTLLNLICRFSSKKHKFCK
jgi:hypothetical protein